jgi:uncharacterized protein YcbK (DUF882 family)
MALTFRDLTMGRERQYANELTDEIQENLEELLLIMQLIEAGAGWEFEVASGWRPLSINANLHGAKKSLHQYGLACDIRDSDGRLVRWVIANLDLMQKLGVYMEDFRWTRNWVHFQIRPPRSRRRIFMPYADQIAYPMTAADRWDGKYDPAFDGAIS